MLLHSTHLFVAYEIHSEIPRQPLGHFLEKHHGRQDKCFMENWELGERGPLTTLIKADAWTGLETNRTICPYKIINLLDIKKRKQK
jgi:hypothetical protein